MWKGFAVGVAAALLAVASPASASNLFQAFEPDQGETFPVKIILNPLVCIALVPAALCFVMIIVGPFATHVISGEEIYGYLLAISARPLLGLFQ